MGWTHEYKTTTSIEQRAQRAQWLKTDPEPDFEIPMLIDYINVEGKNDNAIKRAYQGGGFYSGYVIDCDGTVLVRESWAWHDSGGEWWGLPLAHINELEGFLDDYLADPPSCYTGNSAAKRHGRAPTASHKGVFADIRTSFVGSSLRVTGTAGLQLHVTDARGRAIAKTRLGHSGAGAVDLSHAVPGTYFVGTHDGLGQRGVHPVILDGSD